MMVWRDGVTDTGMVHLKGLTSLETLGLQGTPITDAGVVSLKEMINLQVLLLSGTQVTKAGVAELQKTLPRWVTITQQPSAPRHAVTVCRSGCRTSCRWCCSYSGRTRPPLSLYWSYGNSVLPGITDAELAQLSQLMTLERLHLNDVKITDAGVAELKRALPNCEIIK